MSRRDTTPAMHEVPAPNPDVPAGLGPLSAPELAAQVIDSRQLLQGQKVLHIHHEGALYQLRTTKSGKLILTK